MIFIIYVQLRHDQSTTVMLKNVIHSHVLRSADVDLKVGFALV